MLWVRRSKAPRSCSVGCGRGEAGGRWTSVPWGREAREMRELWAQQWGCLHSSVTVLNDPVYTQ